MKQILLISMLFSCGLNASAQSSFSLSPDYVEGTKPASNFVIYNYGQFENHTNDTLQMRWVRTSLEVTDDFGQSQGADLGDWAISIQDPSAFYNPAIDVDSADFAIPEITGAPDKFILQLYPNNQSGNLLISFLIFPIDNPDDQVTITFDFTITPVSTSTSTVLLKDNITLTPNPASSYISLENTSTEHCQLVLYSPEGILIKEGYLEGNSQVDLDLSGIPDGNYFIRLESNRRVLVKKIVVLK